MDLRQKEKLLRDVGRLAGPILDRHLRVDSCLNATRILLEVLRELGFSARPLSVKAFAYNAVYVRRLSAGLDPMDDPRAWGVAIETRVAAGTGWPGHLVTLVENRWLLDGSASQFDRPHKSIHVPKILIGDWPKKGHAIYELEGGGVLRYEARPRDLSFQKVSGFCPHVQNLDVAKEISEAVAKRRVTSKDF